MSPDLLPWLAFTLKITVTAGFVVVCSLIAERAGALVGALVVTLPASAGPAYVLLAIDHDASFVAGAAVGGLAMVSVNTVFCLAYAAVAQRHGIAASFAAAFATWIVLAVLAGSLTWTFAGVIMLTLVTFGLCVPLAARFCHGTMPPREHRSYDVLLRVLLVCILVAAVVGLSAKLGPVLSGSLALFPIALSSTGLILHRRISGVATAAVMANAIPASAGFATGLALLHFTAVLLGTAPALGLTLLVSVVWNIVLWSMRRHGGLCRSLMHRRTASRQGGARTPHSGNCFLPACVNRQIFATQSGRSVRNSVHHARDLTDALTAFGDQVAIG